MEFLKEWLGLVALAISVGGVVHSWLTSGGTKALAEVAALKTSTNERFDEVEKAIDQKCDDLERNQRVSGDAVAARFGLLDLQLARFEEAFKHLPDRNHAHDLAMAIEKMAGQITAMDAKFSGRMDTLDERLKPVAAASARLQNFLMEQGAEK